MKSPSSPRVGLLFMMDGGTAKNPGESLRHRSSSSAMEKLLAGAKYSKLVSPIWSDSSTSVWSKFGSPRWDGRLLAQVIGPADAVGPRVVELEIPVAVVVRAVVAAFVDQGVVEADAAGEIMIPHRCELVDQHVPFVSLRIWW